MSTDASMIFFRSGKFDMAAAERRLLKERGIVVARVGDGLEVQRHDGPKVRVGISNAKRVQQEAAEMSANNPQVVGMDQCDVRFEITFDNLNEVLDEDQTLFVVQDTLQYATQGYLFNTWNGELSGPPEVWQLCSGPLTFAEIEEEIAVIIGLLLEADTQVVLVSYGFGCQCENLEQVEGIPVATSLLSDFLDRSEESGVYPFGEANLDIRSEDGRIRFLLCHESDVHCSGSDAPLVAVVRKRWARLYQQSCEQDESEGTWRPLSG